MSKILGTANGAKGRKISRLRGLGLGLPVALAAAPAAHALQLYDGSTHGNNVEINLNITASYTGMLRVGHVTPVLADSSKNLSGYQGDANFRHGLVNNLFEVLPVLDIKDGQFGMHFSGEYYINTVYLQGNTNNQPDPVTGVVDNGFNKDTRYVNGDTGRMLDAFVYDSWAFGNGQQFTLKAGQQTLFWGQSLFSTNGISGGQAAIDTIAADNIVNAEAQQIFLPIGQIVATYQPNATYTIQGYYQYQWIPYNLAGVGSFFSTSDATGPGATRLVLAPGFAAAQTKAVTPRSQNGQFGLSVQAQYGNYDVGVYALRYDNKTPEVGIYGLATASPSYHLIYARDIWLYGTSLSTTVGATNIAGEVSVRTHNPLVGTGAVSFGAPTGDANGNPIYPVGNTMTALVNAIYGSPALRFDPGGITVTGEVEWDKLLRVTANKAALAPGRSNDAFSFDVSVSPAYFEVLPNLELQFPVSLAYGLAGNSRVENAVEGGAANHGAGSYSASIVATYKENWDASLNYVGYFGTASANPTLPQTAGSPDRSYVSLNLQHTF